MSRGLYGQQPTLMEELKAVTFLARAQLKAILPALYPFQLESKTFLLTLINPETRTLP